MELINKQDLISEICLAFKGVTLGKGIGLREGQAIDDYESIEKRTQCRAEDEKINWEAINHTDLIRFSSSLSFFDAEGMRFHLPAFLLSELADSSHVGIDYLIGQFDWMARQFSLLNAQQKRAVVKFLKFCALQKNYELDRPLIEKAIGEFWGNA